ncbi:MULTISPECIES: nuclear transport factor 2 family protein [unclassified Leptolyngbya]|uniref:nuclear transport factor 2 family protein n=1 Tax=unclassified Leptolyngbya TaxID=2650499 RepID=UPI001685A98C|nr:MULTISPECIES: nuclear transport factor 2 family protein [unclassified Leptolyngbya]MBD1913496.1 nuclear transport factor 2 family protein [Leptolyngbya sp. FACHB-8]MBD2153282.1 nuclear transport factor 2 family protein [Leptolyngbya sp. FACHB-16]
MAVFRFREYSSRVQIIIGSQPTIAMVRLLPTPQSFPRSSAKLSRVGWQRGMLAAIALFGSILATDTATQAQTEPVPAEIQTLITNMDQAASQEDLDGVMDYVSRDFTHADGFTYDTLEQALTTFWERYDNLSYTTTVNSWERDGDAVVVETTTHITGTQTLGPRSMALDSTLTSRQHFQNDKLVQQETLTEANRVSSGQNPPELTVNLPQQVAIGRSFNFDAVVMEPLGNRQLLGAALEEPVNVTAYQTTPGIDLELLTAGGLFKVGRAPALPEQRWVSGLIIREDGITMETRRVQFGAD